MQTADLAATNRDRQSMTVVEEAKVVEGDPAYTPA